MQIAKKILLPIELSSENNHILKNYEPISLLKPFSKRHLNLKEKDEIKKNFTCNVHV